MTRRRAFGEGRIARESISVVKRIGELRVARDARIGQRFEKGDERGFLRDGQIQPTRQPAAGSAGRIAERRREIGIIDDSAVVEFDHLLKRREPSVVHVRRGALDVAEGWHFEKSVVLRAARDTAEAEIHERKFEAVIVDRIAGHKIVAPVAVHASDLAEELPPLIFLPREIGKIDGNPGIVFRLRRNNRANELREHAGDAVGGDGRRAEDLIEKIGVVRLGTETGFERGQSHAHFHGVLDGLEHLVFERGRAFIPKIGATQVVAVAGKTHRIPSREPAQKSNAESPPIRVTMLRLMARSAGDRLVQRKAFIPKQDAPEFRAEVRDGVRRRGVDLRDDLRRREMRRKKRIGVVERRGRQEQRVRRGAGNVWLCARIEMAEEKSRRIRAVPDCLLETPVVDLDRRDIGPRLEIRRTLQFPDMIPRIVDGDADGIRSRARRDACRGVAWKLAERERRTSGERDDEGDDFHGNSGE